jgi:hypothetical protein
MFGFSNRSRSLAIVAIAAASLLGACVTLPAPGAGGGTTFEPLPITAPNPPQTASCQETVGSNGGVGFWDIGLGQCWACPAGSNRTIFDVRGSDACQFGFPFGQMVAAERL